MTSSGHVVEVHILSQISYSLYILQEVLLQRTSPDERLGLTLCYETDAEDGLTDIFIDDIHPDGLAAKDGRLRLGDQIIQVILTI